MTSKRLNTIKPATNKGTGLKVASLRNVTVRVICVALLLFSFLNISPASAQFVPGTPSISGGGFGQVGVGDSKTIGIVVSNPTTFTIAIYSIGTVAAPFAVNAGTCTGSTATLAPGQSCTINASFSPITTGNATAVLQVNGTWGTSNVNLSGTGFIYSKISGNVTIQGSPANKQQARVFLNGAQPQYPDATGKYGYNNLFAGNYAVSLEYDKTLYAVDTGQDSVNLSLIQGVNVSVNFNLVPKPAATTTTTTAPTTAVPTVTTTAPTTAVTTPVTTPTTVTSTPNCAPTSPNPGFIDLVICRQSVLPNNQYVLSFTLHNGLKNTINVRNSVEISLAPGVTVVASAADTGGTRTENNPNRIIWNGYDLPAGQTGRLSVTVEAPATSAGQVSSLLSSDVLVSAIDAVTGSRYEGRVGGFASTSGVSRTSLQPVPAVPGKVPATGFGNTQDDSSWLLGLFGLAIVAIATGWVAQASYRNRVRK